MPSEPIHKIIDQLLPLAVRVDTLVPDITNPRKGDVEAVKRSLRAFSQRKPIVARSDGTITAGHHVYAAAIQLGWTHVAAVLVDDDDATAKAFGLADNRTSDLGRYDPEALASALQYVADAGESLLEATSYSLDDLDALLGIAPPLGDTSSDNEGDNSEGHACPNCGFPLP